MLTNTPLVVWQECQAASGDFVGGASEAAGGNPWPSGAAALQPSRRAQTPHALSFSSSPDLA